MFDYPLLGFIDMIPENIFNSLNKTKFTMLSDGQAIAINQGLFNNQNLLVVLPTGSGKSLIGNLAMLESRNKNKQSIYLSPLRSLTNEQFIKFRDQYKKDFGGCILTTGEYKKADWLINKAPFIFTTAEKLDVLIRKNYHFLQNVGCVVIDELHTLNQESRGATLEIVITMLKYINPEIQIIGLSATIGNMKEVASWLNAKIVYSDKRIVKLMKGIYCNKEIKFYE